MSAPRTYTRPAAAIATLATVAAMAVVLSHPSDAPVPPAEHAPTVTHAPSHPSRSGDRPRLSAHLKSSAMKVVEPAKRPIPRATRRQATVTTISRYINCDGNAQPCIDRGNLTMYAGNILAGHNYMGWSWLDDVPVGRTVRVTSGPLDGTYRVYGHLRLGRQGGSIPSFGGAALVLQTCAGSGTGFSLLKRA